MYYNTITDHTLALLKSIQSIPELAELRLVGGTALALQIGHRMSIDLDLFGKWNYDDSLEPLLSRCGEVILNNYQRKMQFFTINGIKTDFVEYDFPWIGQDIIQDGIRLASIEDIGAMKINAIINRGTKKDFIDLAFLLRDYNLATILDWYKTKYSSKNLAVALRSLVYFVDAEAMPMPKMIIPLKWDEAKSIVSKALRNYAL